MLKRLVRGSLLLCALLVGPAWAGCPEDLAATSEYAGVLTRGHDASDRANAQELAGRQKYIDQLQGVVRTLQAELEKLKAAAAGAPAAPAAAPGAPAEKK